MKKKELKNLNRKELNEKLEELRRELIKINAQIATGTTLKSPGQVKNIKKTMARIITVIKQRSVANE